MMVRVMAGRKKMVVVMVIEMAIPDMLSTLKELSAQQLHTMEEGMKVVKEVVMVDMIQTVESTREDLILVMWW